MSFSSGRYGVNSYGADSGRTSRPLVDFAMRSLRRKHRKLANGVFLTRLCVQSVMSGTSTDISGHRYDTELSVWKSATLSSATGRLASLDTPESVSFRTRRFRKTDDG